MLFYESKTPGGYERPYPLEKLPAYLKDDPVHRWRAETGIELLHVEPDAVEFRRILRNWMAMPKEWKKRSDEKSVELFGKDNLSRVKDIEKLYRGREDG
jgi:hypothetical protein